MRRLPALLGATAVLVLSVLAGLLAGLVVLAGPAAAEARVVPGPPVVVGAAGLRWQDVGPATPVLAALVPRSAVGVLSVKAPDVVTCPADGWLTLGAGARARAFGVHREPCSEALVPLTDEQRRRNLDATDEAELGLLGTALRGSGSADLRTQGPGAALVGAGATDATGRAAALVVDAGTVVGAPGSAGREASLRTVDAAVGRALDLAGPDRDLLVVGLSESPGEGTAHLHVALAHGPGFPAGLLSSASTRRDGFVQLIDVAPTVLALSRVPVPAEMDGEPWRRVGGSWDVGDLVDRDERAVEAKRATVPLFVAMVAFQVLVPLALHRRPRAARAAAVGGLAAVGASYVAMLVPWWRSGAPLATLVGLVIALAAVAAGLALRTRHPVGWTCGGTALLLAGDLLTGAHLQLESPAGYSSLVAGRFAGIGNVAFGVYGTCALLGAAALAAGRPPRRAGWLVGLAGAVAVAVDGAPPWGSDVGGVLALLPAFLVLGMLLTGTRVSPLRLVLAGLAGAGVVTAFALADYSRPEAERTHLGRFVAQVRDGTAGDVLTRKADAIGNLLFGNPVTALLPLVVVGAVWLFLHPPGPLAAALTAEPGYRQALLAVGLMAALGFALNDSGPAVVALAVVVVIPATAAVIGGVVAGRGAPPAP